MILDRLTIAYQAAQALAADLGAASALAQRINTCADVALVVAVATPSDGVAPEAPAPDSAAGAAAAAGAAPRFISPALTRAGGFGRTLAGRSFGNRPSALAAQARVSAAMEGATDRIANAAGPKVFGLLARVAATMSDHIATVATDLQPVVGVEATRSASSTAIAWGLYGGPARAPELVARNAVACSILILMKLQVLAPKG